MKTRIKISYLLIGVAWMLAAACGKDDDENVETVDAELTLFLTDSWTPEGFYMDSHTASPIFYDVCEAPSLYNDATYKEGLEVASQSLVLEEKNAGTLTPSCSGAASASYTWTAIKVSNGWQLKLVSGGKTIRMQVKSYGGDDMELYPIDYKLPETFVMIYKRSQ